MSSETTSRHALSGVVALRTQAPGTRAALSGEQLGTNHEMNGVEAVTFALDLEQP